MIATTSADPMHTCLTRAGITYVCIKDTGDSRLKWMRLKLPHHFPTVKLPCDPAAFYGGTAFRLRDCEFAGKIEFT